MNALIARDYADVEEDSQTIDLVEGSQLKARHAPNSASARSKLLLYNQIKVEMSSIEDEAPRRKYSQISIKKREKLVELVTQKDYIIAKAARRLGIKASTARMIINKFKQTGTYPMKKFRRPASRTPQASEQHPCISYAVEDENILQGNGCQVSQEGGDSQPCSPTIDQGSLLVYFWPCPQYYLPYSYPF